MNALAGSIAIRFTWTAPAAGAGDVTVDVAVNACNGNGSADGGDTYELKSLTFTEGDPSSINDIDNIASVSVFPNPVRNLVHINTSRTDNYSYVIYGVNGTIEAKGQFRDNASVDVSSLSSGMHIIRVFNDTKSEVVTFNKL